MAEFDDYLVRGMSLFDIEGSATSTRLALPSPDEPAPDIVGLAQLIGRTNSSSFEVEFVPDTQMGRAIAYVARDAKRLLIRETVGHAADIEEPDARFAVAHELGHLILGHAKQHNQPMHLVAGGNDEYRFIPETSSSEWQANTWARAFLMPADLVRSISRPTQLSDICKLPIKQAKIRIEVVREFLSGTRQTPPFVSAYLDKNARTAAQKGPHSEKLSAWNRALLIKGENPLVFRKTYGGYRIAFHEFEKRSGMGWFIRDGLAVSYMQEADY